MSGIVPNALITLRDVAVKAQNKDILQQINFELYTKEIVSIVGPNGAGKSTFVKVLLKILKPTQGMVAYERNLRVAYVPQKFNPANTLPLRVQDLLSLEKCHHTFKQQIIAETGIAKLLNSHIQQLSGGEKQRVLLARALLRQPQVLVLDEPMQGLDIQAEAEMNDYVQSLPERYGCSIVIVSHNLQWVIQGTSRVICLNKHICCTGSPESIQHHPEYQAIFGRSQLFYQHHHQQCQHNDTVHHCDNQQHQPYPHLHDTQYSEQVK